jgi:hypothetical protein
VCTLFDDFSLVQYHDVVGVSDRAEPMCDDDDGPVFIEMVQTFDDGLLIVGVQ